MNRKIYTISSFVLFITLVAGCKPSAKHSSKGVSQSSPSVSVQQKQPHKTGEKRVNIVHNLNVQVPNDPSDKERMRIAEDWLYAIQDVAKKSGLKEAQNDDPEMIRCNAIRKPHQDLLVTIGFSNGITANHFRIVPILERDMGGPIAKTYMPPGVGGRYSPSLKVLWVRSVPYSKFAKGLLLLHEGAHVLQTDPHYQYGEEGWCSAEYDAFGIQVNVVRAIGGKKYKAILLSRANEMLVEFQKSSGRSVAFPEYDSRYDAIFGKAVSLGEIGMRKTIIGMDALHTMLDSSSRGPNKEAFLKRSICQMYKTIGGEGMKKIHGN